ncbi:MAG TPA: hypothetical protein VLM11_10425 [Streptosporangiaceae bacterium]|nr:hypothetical protein [Streptosporangiaceae bacterium]
MIDPRESEYDEDLPVFDPDYDENQIPESDVIWGTDDDEDEEAAWLRGLPDEVCKDYLAGAWTGIGGSEAAGFLHHDQEPSGRGFAAGGACDTMPPDPGLARLVIAITAGGYAKLGESELIGVLCAWQRTPPLSAASFGRAMS